MGVTHAFVKMGIPEMVIIALTPKSAPTDLTTVTCTQLAPMPQEAFLAFVTLVILGLE